MNITKKFKFDEVPKLAWVVNTNHESEERRIKVFLSVGFLVQVFDEETSTRLSINRTQRRNGKWVDLITWDELQEIKNAIGYGNSYAIEIYPPDDEVVNVANMRHLWIPKEKINIGWIRGNG